MIWSVVLPLAGALLSVLVPRLGARVAIGASAATLGVGAALVRALRLAEGPLEHRLGGWPPPLGIRLVLDEIGMLFLLLASAVFLAASVYARSFFRRPEGVRGAFWPLWLLVLAALNGLFLTADLFNMYVALELLTLASVALVAITNDRASVQAAIRYLLAGLVASLFFLLGIALLYAEHGVLDLEALAASLAASGGGDPTRLAVPLILVGLAVKTALFPFHFWLPPAHGSAFAPVSAVLSGLVVKGPFFLLLRLVLGPLAPAVPPLAGPALGALALVGILWGSVRALQQPRLKLLIAYSTVAQIGYLFLSLTLAITDPTGPAVRGGIFYALAHGSAKAAMFLAAGALVRSQGHDRIADLVAPQRGAPLAMAAFVLAGASVMGFPPSGGFVGKWLMGEAAARTAQWWTLGGIVLGGLLAAVYLFRVFERAWIAPPEGRVPARAAPGLGAPALILGALSLALGVLAAFPMALLP